MQISVPATSANLGPGFDTLGLAIDLRNEVIIKPSRFLSISTHGEGSDIPHIKKNTMFMNIFNKHYKRLSGKHNTFRFEFTNQIPISRGLGSSSALIVSAITSAYSAAGIKYNKREILNHALKFEKHPDNITSAVMGGFNVACVEGGRVFSKKRRIPDYLRVILTIPDRKILTNRSRSVLPKVYPKEEMVFSLSRAAYMTALFMSESWDQLKIASKDKIHQERRMKMMPELFEVQRIAIENGALMSTLSGSGSTILSLSYKDDSEKIASQLAQRFGKFRVLVHSLDNYGVTVKS